MVNDNDNDNDTFKGYEGDDDIKGKQKKKMMFINDDE